MTHEFSCCPPLSLRSNRTRAPAHGSILGAERYPAAVHAIVVDGSSLLRTFSATPATRCLRPMAARTPPGIRRLGSARCALG
jgi:hypothetical protein